MLGLSISSNLRLPKSLKVLLENLLRYEDGLTVDKNQILAIKEWLKNKKSNTEIAYRPSRTLLQDYTGIPAIADLAAMRDAVMKELEELYAQEQIEAEGLSANKTSKSQAKSHRSTISLTGVLGLSVSS